MNGRRVGLLWDSASPNMGDQAIGLILRRLLISRGFEPIAIDPFAPGDLDSLVALVIGGGDLIRAPGDPYYDVFRVKGPCILNTVGVPDGSETEYLDDYLLVTVRSQADRSRLGRGEVVPCLTMLMGDHLEPAPDLPELPPDAIGVHVSFAIGDACYDLAHWLRNQDLGPVVFFPLTHYNVDFRLMRALHQFLPGSVLLPTLGPDQAFRAIGMLRGLITCSLHGAIFAYAQQIPFMALSRIAKNRSFLEDRSLHSCGFDAATQIASRFSHLVNSAFLAPQLVDRDMQLCRTFLDRLSAACESDPMRTGPAAVRLVPASRRAHVKEMELYRRQGETAAIYVQAALSKLLHAPQELASPLRVRLGTTDAQGPGPAVELSSDLLGEVDALRRERSLLMDELALTRSELWVTRDRLGRQLRSWPGRFLIAYWSTVSRLVPYGSRRRLIAKRIRSKVRALLRGSAHGVRIGPSRSPAQPAAGAYQPTGPPMPAEPVRLSAADPDYAVLVDRTEPSDRKLRSQWESALAWIAPGEIELVTEVRGSSHEDLWRTFQSIQAQSNPHWRWRLILAPSVSGDIRSRLRDEAGLDLRLRVRSGPSDYSSAANLKAAFEACEARFIALLRTGDLLAPHALYRVAEALRRTPQPDIVYSDADRFVPPGLRADPLFKPDWSPETMLSVNLLENLLVFDRGLLDRVGLPDLDMGTAWLVDFALRLAGRGMRITHLPEVLLHVADSHEEFPARGIAEALERSRGRAAALRSHLRRQGLRFPQVEVGLDGLSRATWGLSRDWRVSLIIPTKESREVLERCVDSLTKRTDYGALELIIVDTGSRSPGIMAYYRSLEDERGVIVEHMDGEFNFGKTCNRGAARASGDLLLFLNNDTEALHPDWLLRMIQWFEIDGIGVVGAKLLYPDGRIQHAGVIVGMGGLASHVFLHSEEGQRGIFGSPEWYRDYSAVTGACMMVRREAFEFVGGFDEEFVVNYSDVDLCLRIRNSGWRIVYTPDARLLHHESYSHQRRIPRRDFERASELWSANGYLQGDPYFNSSLSYMNPRPDYRRMESDNPSDLNKRLMRRLPRKVTLTLPDDVA